ncbi:Translation initiation factor 2 [Fimbriiglobus ruber]|uniref:Translation initiation factor 2 n=1 Tax=Fimbriiglobus ruber TaxID=1908690 RepID=A0A225DDW7_9BACT|nr:Translation initiation factor 2 [Fimbriiglobus ruber]
MEQKRKQRPKGMGTASRVPFKKAFGAPGAKDHEYQPAPDEHKLVRLMQDPNEVETISQFLSSWTLQKQLVGEVIVPWRPSEVGTPADLWIVPAPTTNQIPMGTQYPCGGWYVTNYVTGIVGPFGMGGPWTIDRRDAIWDHEIHPLYQWATWPKMQAGARMIDTIDAIADSWKRSMDNGLSADTIISVPGANQEAVEAALAQVSQRYSGARGNRIIGLAGDEDVKITNLLTPGARDMDYGSGWDRMMGMVCALWLADPTVAGLKPADSYAAFYAKLKQFFTLGLGPVVKDIGEQLTKHLAKRFWEKDHLVVKIDPPQIDDHDIQQARMNAGASSGYIMTNELRGMIDLDPVEGGEVPPSVYVAGLQAKAQAATQPQPAPGQPAAPTPPAPPVVAPDRSNGVPELDAQGEEPLPDTGDPRSLITDEVLQALGIKPGDPFQKGFEDQHPRDDHGEFVDKDEVAAAAKDPKAAAALRAKVTDPGQRKKLDAAIAAHGAQPDSPHVADLKSKLAVADKGIDESMKGWVRKPKEEWGAHGEAHFQKLSDRNDLAEKLQRAQAGHVEPEEGDKPSPSTATPHQAPITKGSLLKQFTGSNGYVDMKAATKHVEDLVRQKSKEGYTVVLHTDDGHKKVVINSDGRDKNGNQWGAGALLWDKSGKEGYEFIPPGAKTDPKIHQDAAAVHERTAKEKSGVSGAEGAVKGHVEAAEKHRVLAGQPAPASQSAAKPTPSAPTPPPRQSSVPVRDNSEAIDAAFHHTPTKKPSPAAPAAPLIAGRGPTPAQPASRTPPPNADATKEFTPAPLPPTVAPLAKHVAPAVASRALPVAQRLTPRHAKILSHKPAVWAASEASKHAGRVAAKLGISESHAHALLSNLIQSLAGQVVQQIKAGGPVSASKGGVTVRAKRVPVPKHGKPAGAANWPPRPSNPAGKGSLPPRMKKGMDADDRPLSSTHVKLPGHLASHITALADSIPDDHLAFDDGREDSPHITTLYGLHTDDPEDVRWAVGGTSRPVKYRLGRVRVFSHPEHDILYAEVHGAGIRRLNRKLRKLLPHTNTRAKYVPHATIAYVQPGLGAEHARRMGTINEEAVTHHLHFSDADGQETPILLSGAAHMQKAIGGMSANLNAVGGTLVPPAAGPKMKAKRRRIRRAALRFVKGLSAADVVTV